MECFSAATIVHRSVFTFHHSQSHSSFSGRRPRVRSQCGGRIGLDQHHNPGRRHPLQRVPPREDFPGKSLIVVQVSIIFRPHFENLSEIKLLTNHIRSWRTWWRTRSTNASCKPRTATGGRRPAGSTDSTRISDGVSLYTSGQLVWYETQVAKLWCGLTTLSLSELLAVIIKVNSHYECN